MVENVRGLLTHEKGVTFESILSLYSNGGKYTMYHKLLNAKDFEVPQKRERVFIVGVRSDIATKFEYPEKSGNTVMLKDVLVDVPVSHCMQYSEEKKKVMELVPQGNVWVLGGSSGRHPKDIHGRKESRSWGWKKRDGTSSIYE